MPGRVTEIPVLEQRSLPSADPQLWASPRLPPSPGVLAAPQASVCVPIPGGFESHEGAPPGSGLSVPSLCPAVLWAAAWRLGVRLRGGCSSPRGGRGPAAVWPPAVHTRRRRLAGSRAFRSAGLRPGVGGWALLPDPPQASENSAPGRFRAESLCPVIKTSSGTDEGDTGRRQHHLPDGTELPRRQQAEPTTLPPKSWAHSLRRPPPSHPHTREKPGVNHRDTGVQ